MGGIALPELAGVCGLRTSQFCYAFTRSTGVAPYQWLKRRRIARAKDMLSKPQMSIAEVALACGLADQAHLIRSFAQLVGATPGTWRRQILN